MRALGIVGVGLGALLAGGFAVNCSSSSEEPYDAGTLPDVFFPGDDAGPGEDAGPSPDALPAHVADAGDATLPSEGDAGPAADAGDSSVASREDGGVDASRGDAGDASRAEDASDASHAEDASDASSAEDATHATDASGGADASDAASIADDASAIADAGPDASSSFDAAALCATFNASSDPLEAVAAFDGTQLIEEDTTSGSVAGSGAPAYGDAVMISAWSQPVGILSDVSAAYTTDNFTTVTSLPLASGGATDAGPGTGGSASEAWSGTIPAQAHGTTVTWYVVGHDACTGASHYFSNNGKNYQYTTP